MQRFKDWRSRLSDVFQEWENRAFIWGESDCACFAAACIHAMTGADALGTFRGAYASRLGALARIRGRSMQTVAEAAGDALAALGAPSIPPELAMVGDIGVTRDDILCVRGFSAFLARDPSGKFRKVRAVQAWRI